jgi:hypothetical protein
LIGLTDRQGEAGERRPFPTGLILHFGGEGCERRSSIFACCRRVCLAVCVWAKSVTQAAPNNHERACVGWSSGCVCRECVSIRG